MYFPGCLMSTNYQAFFELAESRDIATFKARLVNIAGQFDFPLANAALEVSAPGEKPKGWSVRNDPPVWAQRALDQATADRDPCLMRVRGTVAPFAYDQAFYVDNGAGDLWEEQAPHGYKAGINAMLQLGKGKRFYLGMDRSDPLPTDLNKRMELLADLQLMATFVQDTAVRLLSNECVELAEVALSVREREVLAWASQGKTAWETGMLLSISENTVNKHLQAAAKRLGCTSKAQAVARAFERGML